MRAAGAVSESGSLRQGDEAGGPDERGLHTARSRRESAAPTSAESATSRNTPAKPARAKMIPPEVTPTVPPRKLLALSMPEPCPACVCGSAARPIRGEEAKGRAIPAPAAKRPSIRTVKPAPARDAQTIAQRGAQSRCRPREAEKRDGEREERKACGNGGHAKPVPRLREEVVVKQEGHDVEHEKERQQAGEGKGMVRK